jgi:hypothetical protein
MLQRRAFLGALFAGAVLDPERALWKPGKLISIPSKLAVIPPCPFHIYAQMDGSENAAVVMNGLLRFKWVREASFRDQVQNALALSDSMLVHDIARTELRKLRATPFWEQP